MESFKRVDGGKILSYNDKNEINKIISVNITKINTLIMNFLVKTKFNIN